MSKSDVYVFSTLTSSMKYRVYGQGGADLPTVDHEIFIAGGSNLPDKHLITKYGVMTKISAEDHALLIENEVFKQHQKNGFITIRDKPGDPEKIATDMETRDQSAPLVDEDFEEDQKPVTADDKPTKPGNSRRA